jgi:hypothetical protein
MTELLPKTPISAALSIAALWAFVRYLQMLRVGRKYGAHQYIVVSEEYVHAPFGSFPGSALYAEVFFRTLLLRLALPGGSNIPGLIYAGDRAFQAKYSGTPRVHLPANPHS